jgi:hypothetical protein
MYLPLRVIPDTVEVDTSQVATGGAIDHTVGVKHGDDLETWWRAEFGFGFDALTESEARYLLRAEDADTIRRRLAEAEHEGGG